MNLTKENIKQLYQLLENYNLQCSYNDIRSFINWLETQKFISDKIKENANS